MAHVESLHVPGCSYRPHSSTRSSTNILDTMKAPDGANLFTWLRLHSHMQLLPKCTGERNLLTELLEARTGSQASLFAPGDTGSPGRFVEPARELAKQKLTYKRNT